ncbi:MAG TPA: anti-sigma regulatory factor [Gemmatimonadales bacterium]|jgi:serine/threonine-protein kinase RsbT|nr:anti-sigma regulatory factor [Gemmatimonadales bacterium]
MTVLAGDLLPLRSAADIVAIRQLVRARAIEMGFGLVEQTKIVTAASELARNTVDHGGGGNARIEILEQGTRKGLRMIFEDQGTGIPDIELALRDGYSTGSGLGLGLGGTRRLMGEFDIQSKPGEGTRVSAVRWR